MAKTTGGQRHLQGPQGSGWSGSLGTTMPNKITTYKSDTGPPIQVIIAHKLEDETNCIQIKLDDSGYWFTYYADDVLQIISTIRLALESDSHHIWIKTNESRFTSETPTWKIPSYDQYFVEVCRHDGTWSGYWLNKGQLLHIVQSLEELKNYLIVDEVLTQ